MGALVLGWEIVLREMKWQPMVEVSVGEGQTAVDGREPRGPSTASFAKCANDSAQDDG